MHHRHIFVSTVSTLAIFLCISTQSFALSTNCQAKDDQRNSFLAALAGPMQIIIDDRFNGDQIKAIKKAVDVWNAAGEQIMAHHFFSTSLGTIPSEITGLKSFDCLKKFGGPNFFYILKADNSQWKQFPNEMGTTAHGVTQFCGNPNFSNFQELIVINGDIVNALQFQSIITHELGHAVGLRHSCTSTKDDPHYISCDKLGHNPEYRTALMYPYLADKIDPSSPFPEMKTNLNQNDLVRLQCLYGPVQANSTH